MALSLLLLLYVGFGEVSRIYPKFQFDKLAAQGDIIKNSVEGYLKSGLPLKGFIGFSTITAPLLESDVSILQVRVTNDSTVLFQNVRPNTDPDAIESSPFQTSAFSDQKSRFKIVENDSFYRIELELRNKFERVGSLSIDTPKSLITSFIREHFIPVLQFMIVLVAFFGAVYFIFADRFAKKEKYFLNSSFTAAFLIMSVMVAMTLVNIYTIGIKGKTNALSMSLAERLGQVVELGLKLGDLDGLDKTFKEYKRINPDISDIGLSEEGTVLIHTDNKLKDNEWRPSEDHYVVDSPLKTSSSPLRMILVAIPNSLIYSKLIGSSRNFAILLAASAVAVFLLLRLLTVLKEKGGAPAVGGQSAPLGKWLPKVIKLSFVAIFTLSLFTLIYVGYFEGKRIYPTLQFDKLTAQGEIVKSSFQSHLKSGLPLRGLAGFSTLTAPLLKTDASIYRIRITDGTNTLFENSKAYTAGALSHDTSPFRPSRFSSRKKGVTITENETLYRIKLELRNKFERVGYLTVDTPKSLISEYIRHKFTPVVQTAIGLILLFVTLYFFFAKRIGKREKTFLSISFAIAFLIVSVTVAATLASVYSHGITGKTNALGTSLAGRLGQVVGLGLDLNDIEGLDRTFKEYKKLNPDISYIAMLYEGKVLIHTEDEAPKGPWQVDSSQYVFDAPIKGPNTSLKITHVGIPKKVIYSKLVRSIKNFAVLFAASAFLAFLFLNILTTFKAQNKKYGDAEEEATQKRKLALELIQPVYFLAVFIEGLHTSFLPQFFKDITVSSNVGENAMSILFTIFFASFALSLVPSGNYAQRKGPKRLMVIGILLTALLQFLTAFCTSFYLMALIRVFAGIGQGMLFIGVQSFILKNSARGKTTQGAAIIVFGYNGGVISGASIGGLLIGSMGLAPIFFIEALIGVLCGLYIWKYISGETDRGGRTKIRSSGEEAEQKGALEPEKTAGVGQVIKEMVLDIGKVLKDFSFLKTLLLVGMPAKAALTGVVVFAIPLLLAKFDYVQEDIGQIIMFYPAGVLISSRYVSRLSDKLGKTGIVLFLGSVGSGIGIVMIGLAGWSAILQSEIPFLSTTVLIVGMSVLGLASGFIHAPIMTHVSQTPVAIKIGSSSTTSVYRFLERIGHVAGPIIVGQALIMTGYSFLTICWIGFAFVLFGSLFLLERKTA